MTWWRGSRPIAICLWRVIEPRRLPQPLPKQSRTIWCLVAGKGHEDYQILGTEKVHFDDREEAERALRFAVVLKQGALTRLI